MKVLGIIAEYNPFHNGHAYMLNTCKKASGADYVVVAISGAFTQRGAPAIMDKYARAKMALKGGADLVIELPTITACASAAYFANGGVSLLNHTGVLTHLGFGSELGQLDRLNDIAHILTTEPADFKNALTESSKNGDPYPLARWKALSLCLGWENPSSISGPNNTLAIEYLVALQQRKSNIQPITIKRLGSDYNQMNLQGDFSSATAIRQEITDNYPNFDLSKVGLAPYIQDSLKAYFSDTAPMTSNDFTTMLQYALLTRDNFIDIFDMDEFLSNRIINHKSDVTDLDTFAQKIKTKNYTLTKIQRALFHIILNHTKQQAEVMTTLDYAPYIRILGFNEKSTQLLKAMKNNSDIPIITKPADAPKLLSPQQLALFEKDITANSIYELILKQKTNQPVMNEYQHSPIIV